MGELRNRGDIQSESNRQVNETRSEAAREDYEKRKKMMLELAEQRDCAQPMRIMLKLADAQVGFSDEQALFDYKERNAQSKGIPGEKSSIRGVFQSYATGGSDWLRGLKVFSSALAPGDDVPGLLEVASLTTEEGKKFEAWCQKKFLKAQTLVDVMNAIRADKNIDITALQDVPYRELGRIILETHLDRLMVEKDFTDGKKQAYVELPPEGFDHPPKYDIELSTQSAARDASRPYIVVATYIEEKEIFAKGGKPNKEVLPPTIVRYAHGVHAVPVDDVQKLCPKLFTEFAPDRYHDMGEPHVDRYTGALVRTMNIQIRGWETGGISDNRYQDIEVGSEELVDTLIDAILDEEKYFSFHLSNTQLLSEERADALYARSAGRVKQETMTEFNLRAWYGKQISALDNITSAVQLDQYKKRLTLTLGDVIGMELAKDLSDYYPERVAFGKDFVSITYTYDSDAKIHKASIDLSAYSPEHAEMVVQNLPNKMPSIGAKDQPLVIIEYVVRPKQVDDAERRIHDGGFFSMGISEEKIENPYPTKTFTNLEEAIDYLDEGRIVYAMEHMRLEPGVYTSAEMAENSNLAHEEIPFSSGAQFPDTETVASTAPPVKPIATNRRGEKIMPYPAIIFYKGDPSGYPPDYFGLIFLTKLKDAKIVEEKARRAWKQKGGLL